MSDYDDFGDEYYDEFGFEDEFGAYERAGGTNFVLETNLSDRLQKGTVEKFVSDIDQIAAVIRKETDIDLQLDMNKILPKVNQMKRLEYRNPFVFLLGFYVSVEGTEINKKLLSQVSEILKHDFIAKQNIQLEDIIKYARLIIKLD